MDLNNDGQISFNEFEEMMNCILMQGFSQSNQIIKNGTLM